MSDVKAQARYVGISAQKTRLVVDMVRGRNADEALNMLKFTPKTAAKAVYKVVRTAVATICCDRSLATTASRVGASISPEMVCPPRVRPVYTKTAMGCSPLLP